MRRRRETAVLEASVLSLGNYPNPVGCAVNNVSGRTRPGRGRCRGNTRVPTVAPGASPDAGEVLGRSAFRAVGGV